MSRAKSQYACQDCGYKSSKWLGKCPDCGIWNSFAEEISDVRTTMRSMSAAAKSVALDALTQDDRDRISIPSKEFHRVLGGGLTRGSVVLLAGDPGIGKSTLLLQTVGVLGAQGGNPLLYISGEESVSQIKQRANRLNVKAPRLHLLPETNLEEILKQLETFNPEVVIVDSIQTLYWPETPSIPGSIAQVREVADRIVRFAKSRGITLFLVGHVNKEGGIAGPMALEHLVDTVLFLEGERGLPYRILRALKNRFGPTDEIGVFAMKESGMEEVTNPSELFLRDRAKNAPGTIVFPAMEGTRPLLVEVQGLATKSSFGVPLRNAVGFDKNRLTMLLAVLEKRGGVHLYDQDVYINVVGGIRISEPAIDLAVTCAVLSSMLGKPISPQTVAFGEVGLTGEIRSVSHAEARLKEATKLGFTHALLPKRASDVVTQVKLEALHSVDDLIEFLR